MVTATIPTGEVLEIGTTGDDVFTITDSIENTGGTDITINGNGGDDELILDNSGDSFAIQGASGGVSVNSTTGFLEIAGTNANTVLEDINTVTFDDGVTIEAGVAQNGVLTPTDVALSSGAGTAALATSGAQVINDYTWDGATSTVTAFAVASIVSVDGIDTVTAGTNFGDSANQGLFTVSGTNLTFTADTAAIAAQGNVDDTATFTFEVVVADSAGDTRTVDVSYTTTIGYTGGADTFQGGDDPDNENGLAGDDVIRGGDGNDTLEGGAGEDSVFGEDGDDTITNTGGDSDFIRGGNGADTITGGADGDNLGGGNGNDTITGGAGDDTIFGSGGADVIQGGGGKDVLNGGGGDDFIIAGSATISNGMAGPFIDATNGSPSATPPVPSDAEAAAAATSADGLEIRGGAGDDIIFGSAGNSVIRGGAGADIVNGGDGDEIIFTSLDGDTLNGGAGADTFVIKNGIGETTIGDFNGDQLNFSQTTFTSISDVLAAAYETNTGVTIVLDDTSELSVANLTLNDLATTNTATSFSDIILLV